MVSIGAIGLIGLVIVAILGAAVLFFLGAGILLFQAFRRPDKAVAFAELWRSRDYRQIHPVGGSLLYAGALSGSVSFFAAIILLFG